MTEASEKQNLFINYTWAQLGHNILWKMFLNGMIKHHRLFLNLGTMKVNPINIIIYSLIKKIDELQI
ncbi:hypothetical protein M092_4434 [Parabacteroides distasonis str. 3776 D15 iv]|uniref:Uncharacterized protein n=1 Tax=Parabacteroides distasonis str. 3776 D15 i TaxID=1339342 RepID=A0AB34LEG8_PARDI|nr:hypothetical protein M091_1495 [Parabacteroides distasonis str. 3776 D15 i]KDS52395.1 hypothetical protein M090_2107 [Parabacteroides distasonis str. 3776 Po2 i]KDS66829.1 hypothetical protein M092_4434 [Parabacteroides distasonis str. 3776 D15 iv]